MTTINDILRQSVSVIREWTMRQWANQPDRGFNWLGLAEVASHNARQVVSDKPEEAIQWAEIALLVYSRLPDFDPNMHRLSCYLSALNLRAFLIIRLHSDYGLDFLDPNKLASEIIDGLGASYSQLYEQSIDWMNRPIDQIRKLRKVKNKCNPSRS